LLPLAYQDIAGVPANHRSSARRPFRLIAEGVVFVKVSEGNAVRR